MFSVALKYIDETNPYDKAGAYAIQGEFALFIEKIEGSYTNVVGLPIERVYEILKENGIDKVDGILLEKYEKYFSEENLEELAYWASNEK